MLILIIFMAYCSHCTMWDTYWTTSQKNPLCTRCGWENVDSLCLIVCLSTVLLTLLVFQDMLLKMWQLEVHFFNRSLYLQLTFNDVQLFILNRRSPATPATLADDSNSAATTGAASPSVPPPAPTTPNRKERGKKISKDLNPCRMLLEDLESHDEAWPFLLPVNTKQFPTYRKIIKTPMDLSTIKKKLQDAQWVAVMLSFINSIHM